MKNVMKSQKQTFNVTNITKITNSWRALTDFTMVMIYDDLQHIAKKIEIFLHSQ
jgi:hypothetical protein